MAQELPKSMRAWQYTTAAGGLDNDLRLNSSAPLPVPKADFHLVRVLAMAFNPVDWKPAEVGFINRLAIKKPAVPGIDFVGRIAKPAPGSSLQAGQLVFGMAGASFLAGGALADYVVVATKAIAAVPEGMKTVDGATIGVAGLTAYQSIIPYTKAGSRVFINGGSGGTGMFGIQIAKIHGCHVTTTCSTANVELCQSLGADEVIDYKKEPVIDALAKRKSFDHVVDNVGGDFDVFWRAGEYTNPGTKVVWVAGKPTMECLSFITQAKFRPAFLGGGQRAYQGILAEPKVDELEKIAAWIAEGKIKTVIDGVIPFENAPEGVKKQKTARAKGKIIVDVALKEEK